MRRCLITILIFLLAGALVNVAVAWGCALGNPPALAGQTSLRVQGDSHQLWRVDRLRGRGVIQVVSAWVDPQVEVFHHDPQASFVGSVLPMPAIADQGPPPQSLLPGWATFLVPAYRGGIFHCDVATAYGWPFPSLWCAECETCVPDRRDHKRECVYGFPSPLEQRDSPTTAVGTIHPDHDRFPEFFSSLIRIPDTLLRDPTWTPDASSWGPFPTAPFDPQSSRLIPLAPIWHLFAVNTLFYAPILWLLICGPFALRRFLRRRRGLCPKCAYPMGDSSVCTECGKALPSRARPAK
jgi:hypothetical protein